MQRSARKPGPVGGEPPQLGLSGLYPLHDSPLSGHKVLPLSP